MAKVQKVKNVNDSGIGFAMFVAWVGALVYFVNQVDGLGNIIIAFFKACVWPAYLLYYVLQALGA